MPDEPTIPMDPARTSERVPIVPEDRARNVPAPVRAPATSDEPAELQRHLPQYRVRELVGRGGMGNVLKVDDPKLARTVALKTMRLGPDATEEQRGRFVREATVLARLAHPNIVPIYDLGADDQSHPFYTMKLVKGRTLQAIIKDIRNGVPEAAQQNRLERLLGVFRKVCDAIAFAHSKGVLHRDLKPENIMVGEFGEVLVMDWGLAKLLGGEHDAWSTGMALSQSIVEHSRGSIGPSTMGSTLAGSVLGTPQYMSPEQGAGKTAELDERSDIFSLGAILYSILTLHPPVEGKTVEEVLRKISSGQITPPSTFGSKSTGEGTPATKGEVLDARVFRPLPHCPRGHVPAALSAVTMKALSVDRARRYQSVHEFAVEVEAWQGGFATGAEKAGLGRQLVLLIHRHKAVFTTAFAAWLIITALAVWFVVNVTKAKNQAEAERNRATANEEHAVANERRAESEKARAESEKARAEKSLTELRGTAPTFVAQAAALVESGKLEAALVKLGYAIQLDPKNPAYQLQRAHLLEAGEHLAEAATAYREVLALDPENRSAKDNLALCERLQSENGGAPTLQRELEGQLVDALIREGRGIEAGSLAAQLGKDSKAIEATLRARLKEYIGQPGWNEYSLERLPNGTFKVTLDRLKLGDLSVLRGLPISILNLNRTDIKDLQRVVDLHLPLTELHFVYTQVTDLTPLRGLRLRSVVCDGCRISDINPLRGMPLQELRLEYTDVSDLSALAGMPLKSLNLRGLGNIKSLAPLRAAPLRQLDLLGAGGQLDLANLVDCRELETIVIASPAVNIKSLRELPKLSRLRIDGYEDFQIPSDFLSSEKFWAIFKPEMEAAADIRFALKKAGVSGLTSASVGRQADGSVNVNLSNSTVTDLGFLHGLPVSRLSIFNTKIHDLTPLRGLPLKYLNANNCPLLTDLEPLRGLPLTEIYLMGSPIATVAPLQDCPALEKITLPAGARDVETLRQLPKLRWLSYTPNSQSAAPNKTAEQFWKEYDAQQAAGKK